MKIPHFIETTGMLIEWMKTHEYDGLCCDGECSCEINDLMPCGDGYFNCEAGYKIPCDCGDHEFHIISKEALSDHIETLTAQLATEKRAVERLIDFESYCHEGLSSHCTDRDCKACKRDYAYRDDAEKGAEG